MKFFEKYKLYKKIIKNQPDNLITTGLYQSIFFRPTIVFEKVTYCVNECKITAFTKFKMVGRTKNHEYIIEPVDYIANVTVDQGEYIEFKSLLAKKLFNHGKNHNK